jgi:hypothetical protein
MGDVWNDDDGFNDVQNDHNEGNEDDQGKTKKKG